MTEKKCKELLLFFNSDVEADARLPKGIKDKLGPTTESIQAENERRRQKISKDLKERKKELRKRQGRDIDVDEVNRELDALQRQMDNNERQIANLESENEKLQGRMSLRDRIKDILKKYGFTVFAILSAINVVLSVVLSNLKIGLTKLGKGVGDGFKAMKKLIEILPGIVRAIVSFIFKTAGEVISFLGKNAWLLVVAVVAVYAVEKFKSKNKK